MAYDPSLSDDERFNLYRKCITEANKKVSEYGLAFVAAAVKGDYKTAAKAWVAMVKEGINQNSMPDNGSKCADLLSPEQNANLMEAIKLQKKEDLRGRSVGASGGV
jgi:hypothetical protein